MKYFFIFSIVILFSCRDTPEKVRHPESAISYGDTTKFVYGKPYIDYDKIDYYTINISQDSVMNLLSNGNKLDSIKSSILLHYYATNDTIYEFKNLPYYEKVGYSKCEISQKYFSQVNKVFCHKTGGSTIAFACIHEYRDILVFKKENKVVAIAKICLSCMDINLNGIRDISNEELGWENDFDILDKVLKANKN